jgi:hypothetical protein
MRYLIVITLAFSVSACGAKKVVARNCEKAGNADVFVCDSL